VSLRTFSTALIRQGVPVARPLQNWGDAIALLFSALRDQPRTVVIDEFPFLVKASPSLPSIIQRELGPGGSGQASAARLLLCGSAMSVMGGLLAGQAPLRGRASLELLIRPFGYTDAARFWGADDPKLALLLHAVVAVPLLTGVSSWPLTPRPASRTSTHGSSGPCSTRRARCFARRDAC
jgi:hypothetical protein